MTDFDDELRKIKMLGGEYEKKISAEKQDLIAKKKQSEAAAEVVKAKITELKKNLTCPMPFQVGCLVGESPGVKSFPLKGKVYLIKGPENEIYINLAVAHNCGMMVPYTTADADLLVLVTDQKLHEFLNAIQEELKKRLTK